MKVLWLCNVMLPAIAEQLHMEASNKEGWITGLAEVLLRRKAENGIDLAIAFPVPAELLPKDHKFLKRTVTVNNETVIGYGFAEDTVHPEHYDAGLEESMKKITGDFHPDMIHCFGTEYPHTLAMCRAYENKKQILITIQGLCSVYANVYFADLEEKVKRSVTFRDWLKKDTLLMQQEKYVKRGAYEIEAVKLAGNVGGRTPWDYHYALEWNPGVRYFEMRETLRSMFYEGRWERANCIPHSIFLSQGDYPIKGFHYMLKAMPKILKKYPDAQVFVAGNSLVNYETLKDKIKISAYGKYLRQLIRENHLEGKVTILGKLTGAQMKEQYLKSHLFVCPSSIENSPNSLGEAMILGMPCVSAEVGGVTGIFTDGEDGILYPGCKSPANSYDRVDTCTDLEEVSDHLAEAVLAMWDDEEKQAYYCENAAGHASRNHDRDRNYAQTVAVYTAIVSAARK
ncbi:MAG: glycosyltransferase family 4 protein [Acetatifactor sp.]|nr:glycosyltransferase family 4 protein [Acetatifactor sp.]